MKKRLLSILIIILLFPAVIFAEKPNNEMALKGLKTANVAFDVNTGNPKLLLLRLKLIEETVKGIEADGVKTHAVVAFRGKASFYMTKGKKYVEGNKVNMKIKIRKQIKKLNALGYRLEQCAVATRLLKIKNEDILPEITVVSNGYISLIGYQAKNYAFIPME